MSHISSARKGKIAEMKIIEYFVNRDFEVYTPFVDDKGVDLLVKNKKGGYFEIQVKTRTEEAKEPSELGLFKNIELLEPRRNYYFAFNFQVDEADRTYFIPTLDLLKVANKVTRSENNKHNITIKIAGLTRKGKAYENKKLERYKENWRVFGR